MDERDPARRRGLRCRCPRRRTGWWSTRAGTASIACGTRRPAAQEARRRRSGKLAPIERFNLVSDAFALAQAGDDAAGRLPRPHRALRDETDRNVWTVLIGSLGYAQPAHRGRLAPASRGAGARSGSRPAVRAARLGAPAPARTSWSASCAATCCARWAPSATTRRPRPAPGRSTRAIGSDESAVDANVLPALIAIVAAAGGGGRVRGVPPALPGRAARRRRSSATSTRSPGSGRPSWCGARSRRRTERRGA